MNGPGPVITVGAYLAFVFLAAVTAAGVALVTVAVGDRLRRRRRAARMMRTPEARRIQREAAVHVDHFAAHDPEVQAGFARLRAALRDEGKGA